MSQALGERLINLRFRPGPARADL